MSAIADPERDHVDDPQLVEEGSKGEGGASPG
jgi:hypothetical protein